MHYLGDYFEHFSLNDTVDILLVSFILYRFLAIVQGTRAVQMLSGIGALFSLYWVSLYFELFSLNWLLNHFFDYFFVILIILFQDQFKSALASFGEAGSIFNKKNSMIATHIEEVVASCMALSRERVGALIVFEKKHGLLNYSLTGTLLESKIHSDILYSIFQTSSPLHDGAVIIQDNKIKAAGCFLPLSKIVELDRQMGTRHRAAIGLGEVSDAVIVVVSEETGRVHVSSGGNILKIKDENDLRMHLQSMLINDVSHPDLDSQGARS